MKSKHLVQNSGLFIRSMLSVLLVQMLFGKSTCMMIPMTNFKQVLKKKVSQLSGGVSWSEGDIRSYEGTAEDTMNAYIDLRSQGRRSFIDGFTF